MTPDRYALAPGRHLHVLAYLTAIHHLAWLVVADADEAGVGWDGSTSSSPDPLATCQLIADMTDAREPGELGLEDPATYLRAAADLLDLACADGATEAGELANTARRLLEAHHAA